MTYRNYRECINNSQISYRSILTIPRDVRFGLELELESVSLERVKALVTNNFGQNWQVKVDTSLEKGRSAEIAMPIFYNTRGTWVLLKKLGQLLERLKPTFDNCSFQVNYDGSLLPTTKDRIKFLKLYAVYEDIIYRFSQGGTGEYRNSLEEYAYPIALSFKAYKDRDDYALEPYTNQKRYGIAFKNKEKDLIEFRTPNATCNPILWQNYITAFYYLIIYSLSSKCNERDLDEYLDKFNKIYVLEYYDNPHEEKAFDLAQKIFRKTDDRMNFLAQYGGKR